jgi:hypothetical protein
MGKPGQSRQAKFVEKGEKVVFLSFFFFSKDAPLIHFIHPKVIVFQYNSFIQTSKISKNHFSKTNISKCYDSQNI